MIRSGKEASSIHTLASVVVRVEVVGRLIREVLDKPPVSKGTIGDECDVKLASRRDQTVVLVDGLEWRELGLDGIDLSNCKKVSSDPTLIKMIAFGAHSSLPSATSKPNIPRDQCTWSCPLYGVDPAPEWILREAYLDRKVREHANGWIRPTCIRTRVHSMKVVQVGCET
jgi:hypothetical protein